MPPLPPCFVPTDEVADVLRLAAEMPDNMSVMDVAFRYPAPSDPSPHVRAFEDAITAGLIVFSDVRPGCWTLSETGREALARVQP